MRRGNGRQAGDITIQWHFQGIGVPTTLLRGAKWLCGLSHSLTDHSGGWAIIKS